MIGIRIKLGRILFKLNGSVSSPPIFAFTAVSGKDLKVLVLRIHVVLLALLLNL